MSVELNYHHLFYFWTCARAGRVTAAARELDLSQSALSLQLQRLEADLGRKLFERTREGVELTTDGRMVFEHCERIFANGAALSAELRGGAAAGTVVRLGVASALGREVALSFVDRLASVKGAETTVFVGTRDDIRERMARRRLDFAVVGGDLSVQLGGSFRAVRVGLVPVVFVAAPELARTLRGFPRLGEPVPMLLRTREHALRRDVEGWLARRGARPRVVAESEDADLLRELARRGRGVAALAVEAARRDLKDGSLVRVGPASTGLHHEVWLVAPAREPLDPVLRAAFAALTDR